MIRKEEIKDHIVMPDTNIIWFKDKSIVVNPAFDELWDNYSKNSNLHLVIPEVVKGEILFQQSTSAIRQMEKVSESIKEVSLITAHKYAHRITTTKIKSQVRKRFEKWEKTKSAKVEESPVNSINWNELIHNSIWRNPPFESDAKHPDNEKGFRDAIILETLIEYCKKNTDDCLIAFICNDYLLRKTAKKILRSEERFSAFESLEDFESYLKLQHEELTDKFIKSILQKASLKFFKTNDLTCLYYREKIHEKFGEKFGEYINDPKLSEEGGPSLGLLQPANKWNPTSDGKYWVMNAQFEKIESENIYHWSNIVTYVRKYQKESMGLVGLASVDNERILILPFRISWTAKVTKDGKFRTLSINSIDMKKNQFTNLTPEFKRAFGF